jgi:hypothetical protein
LIVAPVSRPNCDPDHTDATYFVGAWGEYRIFCGEDGLRDLASRTRAPALRRVLRNCVQIDPVGQVSVAPKTEARGRAIRIGPFIKEDREAVVPCTRNQ